jgi:hypothetical protein
MQDFNYNSLKNKRRGRDCTFLKEKQNNKQKIFYCKFSFLQKTLISLGNTVTLIGFSS